MITIGSIILVYKRCYKCAKKRLLWGKSDKPYVIKLTGGTNYCCLSCVRKQRKKYKL